MYEIKHLLLNLLLSMILQLSAWFSTNYYKFKMPVNYKCIFGQKTFPIIYCNAHKTDP